MSTALEAQSSSTDEKHKGIWSLSARSFAPRDLHVDAPSRPKDADAGWLCLGVGGPDEQRGATKRRRGVAQRVSAQHMCFVPNTRRLSDVCLRGVSSSSRPYFE
eukprot:4371519-Prymnesium_polylepis.1